MQTENRKHERFPSRLRCWCEAENITLYARIVNLSEGGLFLKTNTPLDTGRRTLLRLSGGEVREVMAEATVVWSRPQRQEKGPPGMGLRFEGLEPGALAQLRRIISQEQRGPTFGN
ncbi:TIGR02266 family protein [Vitiosangium sp. GDMCC 1.1324]|uniref:TIGR02266 family protein n=1 Tax=Vitiosangium sp. (strain GDMCC 1.1324) TaxID=2138576 RepID=UPI000D3704C8|nr:TIGR02266 family protein [Vitiosangium sp. GDMCC 1.1324]PTL80983.1 TIGR02266 family protein [Vitiosangium sp. GDMCC 1.1324]